MKEKILNRLNTEFIGRYIVHKKVIDSTNNLAKQNPDLPCGSVFIADRQTNGRGRCGRTWVSDEDNGLWMSILLKPDISSDKLSCLTLVAGLAVVKALNILASNDFYIKWPNDIVTQNKKVCGILCELINSTELKTSIVCGIGINVTTKSFPDEIADIAVSVNDALNIQLTREQIASEVLNQFEPLYFEYLKNGFDNLVLEYKKYCITLNKEIKITSKTENRIGFAVDVTSCGELVVKFDEEIENISSGEVSVRGLFGYV